MDNTEQITIPDNEDDDTLGMIDPSQATKDHAAYDRYDGNSSDDDDELNGTAHTAQHASIEEKANDIDDDLDDAEDAGDGYAVLVEEEEFGDFHGVESEPVIYGALSSIPDATADEQQAESADSAASVPAVPLVEVRRCVAPLTKDKIDLIKSTMANIKIKPPSSMSVSLADRIVSSKLRVGDEI